MIRVKSGGSYVTIEDFSDLEARPRFTGQLDPKNKELEDVIGYYLLPEFIPCGLTSCRTKHKKGYVAVTKDGLETNIGKDCGKTHFGLNFDIKQKAMSAAVTRQTRQEAILEFQFNSHGLQEEVSYLLDQPLAAREIHKMSVDIKTRSRGWPDYISSEVAKMAMSRSGAIIESKIATQRERELKIASGVREEDALLVSNKIGELSAIEALFPENSLKELLISGLVVRLNELDVLEIGTLGDIELKKWHDWCSEAPGLLERAKRSVKLGQKFHSPDNLKLLQLIPADTDDRKALSAKLADHSTVWLKLHRSA
jgi:hypothetical protein